MADAAPDPGALTPEGLVAAARIAFGQASERAGATDVDLRLAGRRVRMTFAGDAFGEIFGRAIAGTSLADGERPGTVSLTLSAWDAESTAAPIHAGSWHGTMLGPGGVVDALSRPPYSVNFDVHASLLGVIDTAGGEAFHYVPHAGRLPAWEVTHPGRLTWAAWGRANGLQLCHAAAVADAGRGLLLVGPSGSGKSTTALACLGAGLACAGDDYVLVDTVSAPFAHALFRTVSLEASHADAHAGLMPVVDRIATMGRDRIKAIMVAGGEDRPTIDGGFPLIAVAVPSVAHAPRTEFARITPGAALRALAPSTLGQLGLFEASALRALASICRRLPCYELKLGRDVAAVPDAVRALLADAARAGRPAEGPE